MLILFLIRAFLYVDNQEFIHDEGVSGARGWANGQCQSRSLCVCLCIHGNTIFTEDWVIHRCPWQVCTSVPLSRLSRATVFAARQSISLFTSHWLPGGGTNLSRTVMTFLDFPLSLEQSITRTWQSKPLCRMNLLHDIFISRIYATQRTKTWGGSKGGLQESQRTSRGCRSASRLSSLICLQSCVCT